MNERGRRRRTHRRARIWCVIGVTVASHMAGGCAGLVDTPDHVRPVVPEKTDWSIELGEARDVDLNWWEGFGDPHLNLLVDRATADNIDLAVMAARVAVAEVQIGQARAAMLPVFNFGIRTDTTNISGDTNFPTSNKFGTGGEMAWELDVWGKARKGVAAQRADYRASEADWRAGYLVVVSSVASSYFQIRLIDEQTAQQQRTIERAEHILRIYRKMHAQGLRPKTLIDQQEAELHRLASGRIELDRLRSLAENALATLLGVAAGELQVSSTLDSDELQTPVVPAGLPSELLARRPDIVAAEYRLMQGVDLEGQARLAQLPRIGLSSTGGSASYGLSNLLSTWTAGLSSVVQFPVFDPNVRANIRVSEAQVKVAEQQYRSTVIRAFEEVENALVNLNSRHTQRSELEARKGNLLAVAAQQDKQLQLGLTSQLEILQSERDLLLAEQDLLENRWQILSDTVSLYKAIGGGWQREDFGS